MTPAPADTARAIVDRVRCGDVVTPGQWYDLIVKVSALPPRLREWVWDELQDLIGGEGAEYLRSWSEQIIPEVPAP